MPNHVQHRKRPALDDHVTAAVDDFQATHQTDIALEPTTEADAPVWKILEHLQQGPRQHRSAATSQGRKRVNRLLTDAAIAAGIEGLEPGIEAHRLPVQQAQLAQVT